MDDESLGKGFSDFIGVEHREGDDGSVMLGLTAVEHHLNPAGTVHGGVIATLIDVAMGRAAESQMEDEQVPATIELKTNYLEPGRPGRIVATAHVRKRGRNVIVVEAEVHQDETDEVIALAIGTYAPV
ncbi:MAG: PaaI family thioesterase [Thermoleophilia bacterium]|nr:PaaI family thioesterase [Thermoleophilia bacterium]